MTMTALLAQARHFNWTLENIIVLIIIVAAAIGVLFIVLRVFNVQIPQWLVQIVCIVVAAVIGIVAIRFLFTL